MKVTVTLDIDETGININAERPYPNGSSRLGMFIKAEQLDKFEYPMPYVMNRVEECLVDLIKQK